MADLTILSDSPLAKKVWPGDKKAKKPKKKGGK